MDETRGLWHGKRLDNGEWVEGFLIKMWGVLNIQVEENLVIEVDPSTLGECTGLRDKNKKLIFEGDIVKLHYFFANYDLHTLGYFEDENEIVAEIRIDSLGVFFISDKESDYLCNYLQEPSEELEIIGNIHDNPELLKRSTGEDIGNAAQGTMAPAT